MSGITDSQLTAGDTPKYDSETSVATASSSDSSDFGDEDGDVEEPVSRLIPDTLLNPCKGQAMLVENGCGEDVVYDGRHYCVNACMRWFEGFD